MEGKLDIGGLQTQPAAGALGIDILMMKNSPDGYISILDFVNNAVITGTQLPISTLWYRCRIYDTSLQMRWPYLENTIRKY
jgi:hypothetical protein